MERHYLQMEYHVQRPGVEKQRVEAQPTEALGLHCEGNGKLTKVSEQKRGM